jgi:hypothetical protein
MACYDTDDDILYIGDGTTAQSQGSPSTGVTAAANITDNAIVRGDGGAKGVQGSTATIDDSGTLTTQKIIVLKTTAAANFQVTNDNGAWNFQVEYPSGDFRVKDTVNEFYPFKIELGANTNAFYVDSDENIGFNTTTFGTNAVGVHGIKSGTAPTTSPADMIQMWVEDYATGDARLYIMTEGSTNKVIIGNGGIILSGAKHVNVTTVNAATYNTLSTDHILHVAYTDTGTVAIDLQTSDCTEGRLIEIKDADFNANANNITVSTQGAETIEEAATAIINTNGGSLSLYCDTTNWYVY